MVLIMRSSMFNRSRRILNSLILQSTQTALCVLCVLNNVAKCVLDVKSGKVMSLSLKYSTNLIHSFFLVRMNTGANHTPHLNHFHTFHSCFIQTVCKRKKSRMKPCKFMTDNQNMYETSMKDVQQQHFFTGSLKMYFAYFVFFS